LRAQDERRKVRAIADSSAALRRHSSAALRFIVLYFNRAR